MEGCRVQGPLELVMPPEVQAAVDISHSSLVLWQHFKSVYSIKRFDHLGEVLRFQTFHIYVKWAAPSKQEEHRVICHPALLASPILYRSSKPWLIYECWRFLCIFSQPIHYYLNFILLRLDCDPPSAV